MPAGTGAISTTNPNYNNILPDHYAKLEWYAPCQPDIEWTIMYYRYYEAGGMAANRIYWRFVWCVCDYYYGDGFYCGREVIATRWWSSTYHEGGD